MKKDFTAVIMNPIRQRIVQFLMIRGTGTPNEMLQDLSDIPPASLYRHVKILLEANCIEVIEEKKIRGTVEKTYGLVQQPVGDQSPAGLVQSSLMSLMVSFERYFAKESNDPVKDLLSLTTSTLMLSDEEYMEFTKKLGELFNEVIFNKPIEGRKPRRVTFISSPCEEDSVQ